MIVPHIITDAAGKPVTVELSYRQWLRVQKDLRALQELRTFRSALSQAFAEVEAHKRGELVLPKLSDILK
jgi:hypothetical protein